MGVLAGSIMSQFIPTQRMLEPDARPDDLPAAVLHSLSRPVYRLAWGPLKTVILGGLSFGILPLISWPRKFSRYVLGEQRQLWHLAEWLRIRTGDEDAAAIRDSVRQAGVMPTLWIVPLIMLGVLAANFLPWVRTPDLALHRILRDTYFVGVFRPEIIWGGRWARSPFAALQLYKLWTACLSIAYFSHWLHVQLHAADVNRVVRRLNLIFARQQVAPVNVAVIGIGLRPLWILAGVAGVVCGAWWAVPAALAGAVHQRYIQRTSARMRGQLALRVGMLLQQQRPAVDVPTPHGFRVICRNHLCGKSAPTQAAYCPRCGSRLESRYGAVA
jgi:hypothetical protein